MSETTKTETSTDQNVISYFWWISGDFSRKLDEPKREYFDGGYRIKEYETGTGFMGATIELPADQEVTRIGMLNYAMDQLFESQNKARRQRGCTVMFQSGDLQVKGFDCGRNVL